MQKLEFIVQIPAVLSAITGFETKKFDGENPQKNKTGIKKQTPSKNGIKQICHTLSSSQRTHTHQHHQPQQPANFSEPCSNFLEFVTLSGATRPAYQTLFPTANPVTRTPPAEPARPTLNPGAQTSAHRNRIRVVIANPKPAPVSL